VVPPGVSLLKSPRRTAQGRMLRVDPMFCPESTPAARSLQLQGRFQEDAPVEGRFRRPLVARLLVHSCSLQLAT
jgi:hypothetical protein